MPKHPVASLARSRRGLALSLQGSLGGLLVLTCVLNLGCRDIAAEKLIPVTTPEGAVIWAELADDPLKRARGLMFRYDLPDDRGMLFTFPEPNRHGFWMKNTRISLDIIWMDEGKNIVHVESYVPPCYRTDDGCPTYRPYKEASYVLEVAAGVARSLKLEEGIRLKFSVEGSRP